MTLRIEAPENFKHAGELRKRFASEDPRDAGFRQPDVEVDLRKCRFVRPAAGLWCLVYLLLAKRSASSCELLVPEDPGVCAYLKSVGLFDTLKSNGVTVDDRDIRASKKIQLVLDLRRFGNSSEVEDLANEAHDRLASSRLGAPNVYPLVSEVFAELALNAVEHARSPIGAYGFIQFYEFAQGQRFVCAVADGGIGIRESLHENPELRARVHYDWDAIELAVRERISSTGEATRGIGLYGVADDMRRPEHQLIIHSGQGKLEITERVETRAERVTLFPGTLASASIPT